MTENLSDFIKYCLGYVKISRQRSFSIQQKHSLEIPNKFFDLHGLLNGEIDGNIHETVKLEAFYGYDPKTVPEEEKENYEEQKKIGDKVEEIYNQHRNYQYTKQVLLRFGFFEIEIPIEIDVTEQADPESDEEAPPPSKIDKFPLFTLPVLIDKEGGEYTLSPADTEVQVNLGPLESVLGADQYYSFVEEVGDLERKGALSLPFGDQASLHSLWVKLKERLRTTEALYDDSSFNLEEMQLTLSPKVNYFLAEDLEALSQLSDEDLEDTSLQSWVNDDELNVSEEPPDEQELYFPFLYDKYQLSVLSVLGNRAAIVQGPPGTGKSETIANVLCHLAGTGKRVLFVSQKAQALKVVKDKLKTLDVKYLYAYVPNPASQQLTEEDETDGVAVELSELRSHLDKLGLGSAVKPAPPLAPIVDVKQELEDTFDEAIQRERGIFDLVSELDQLKEFEIPGLDLEALEEELEDGEWGELQEAKANIERLLKETSEYSPPTAQKELRRICKDLDFSEGYSEVLTALYEDVSRSGYDRHSRLMRKINNNLRTVRLRGAMSRLPRELHDFVQAMLDQDVSRKEALRNLEEVRSFCRHQERLAQLKEARDEFSEELEDAGITENQLGAVEQLISKDPSRTFKEVREKLLRVAQIRAELKSHDHEAPNILTAERAYLDRTRREVVAGYLRNIINENIVSKSQEGTRVRRLAAELSRAFKKSRKAFKTFDKLRRQPDSFEAVMDLIPIWIMELDDASRLIPLQAGIFDYVILDEASQCNVAYTIPSMFRAKRALLVGDSEQMKDTTILFKSNRVFDELARRHNIPENLQIKATGEVVQSVLDIADRRGLISKQLRYYYRSPQELIDFSNNAFYKPKGKELIAFNSNYLTFKDTNRLMLIHEVAPQPEKEIADRANVAEAEAILSLFRELRSDQRYKEKSVGILTFFNFQATYIRELFEKEGFKEDRDNYKISIIEGIQGDEKDIILYSFVIRHPDQRRMYQPLTGEGGDIQGAINAGRVNVAFSRARLQVHCFTSLPIEDMPDRVWIKKYLNYVQDHGEIDFFSTELRDFDSQFEQEFYYEAKALLPKNYIIQNQVESCGFKIDFVITNPTTGKKLAVECDGPTHFRNELADFMREYIESDLERQEVLEAARWVFYRLRYSDWVSDEFDRKRAIKEIQNWLEGESPEIEPVKESKYAALTTAPSLSAEKPRRQRTTKRSELEAVPETEAGDCTLCGGDLKLKSSKRGLFVGCSNYPSCDFTSDPDEELLEQVLGSDYMTCECGAPMVVRHARATGQAFLGCSRFPTHKFTRPLRIPAKTKA
jgi:very-short-patch-repair endonuclease